EIKRARAERIVRAARHALGKLRLPEPHFLRRHPVRPDGGTADHGGAAPAEALAADADAVANRGVSLAQEVEEVLPRIDHERARLLGVRVVHELAAEL